ncbi:hypothetical protein [Halomonas sp. Mc5H-6]|uniref:hypothetical protein n=1 Tax=Halomonas sp. Mc5H-6 TaxID=2954500 RepID=UPI0020969B5B|nr:hypothetical protein [Halomonas sp. Mc5H-6]MCO7246355.1 hypothetical protein [Halomonas sp. Mc5H-6]
MGIFWKIVAALVGGLMFTILGFTVISMAIGPLEDDGVGGLLMLALFIIAVGITWKANSASKAWRRLLISCGVFSLALPISAIIMSSSLLSSGPQGDSVHTVGSAIGYGGATLVTGFFSIFLAAIFLVTGLLIGRDKPST